jgi:adenylate kinase family enzyme
MEDKKCFLIHGSAGSGKSTISRKIEEYLWFRYDK